MAVFAGSALAGNGHGNGNANGNGNGNAAAADASGGSNSSPGNSGNAPGQLKKEEEAAPAPEAAVVVAEVEPANSEGVKPSNTTQKDTHEAASSNKTKEYGNGKTAGQIAIANGAAPSTILHGPGNSQPHKAVGCAGGHEVDVHALKGKGHQKGCGTSSPPVGPTPHPTPGPGGNPGSTPGVTSNPPVAAAAKPEASSPAAEPATTPPADPGTSAGVASAEQDSHGVLAAASVVAHGTLPFTGMQLWAVVLFALMLVGSGLALRRQGAPVKTNDR